MCEPHPQTHINARVHKYASLGSCDPDFPAQRAGMVIVPKNEAPLEPPCYISTRVATCTVPIVKIILHEIRKEERKNGKNMVQGRLHRKARHATHAIHGLVYAVKIHHDAVRIEQ